MMMIPRILISAFIFFAVCVPAILVSLPVVALLLLTKWDGRSTIFGNEKWGRATHHFSHATGGNWWKEFVWIALRNPVNNLHSRTLSIKKGDYWVRGDFKIGDKLRGGFRHVQRGPWWEYYWVHPYTAFGSRRCIRVRIGWKIYGNTDGRCSFVFAFNPWKTYLGA